MQFGVFDHLDRRPGALHRFYEDRLRFAAAAERAGFYAYHVAEHHGTPLGMAPSPGIFLAAMAQRTSTLRLGPMVFVLPLYPPLRMIEEIAMLDNLSQGRLELGVGRSISPHEMGFYGVDAGASWDLYTECLEIVLAGLHADRLDWHSPRYRYDDVPIVLAPMQDPVPLWSAPGSAPSIDFAAAYGMHVVSLGPTARVKQISDGYREAWDRHAGDARRRYAPAGGEPFVGAYRLVHVADSDGEAERPARRAFDHWFGSASKLWRERGGTAALMRLDTYDKARDAGMLIAGSPGLAGDLLEAQAAEAGFNYAMLEFAFGDLGHARERASLELFASEVMPRLVGPRPHPA